MPVGGNFCRPDETFLLHGNFEGWHIPAPRTYRAHYPVPACGLPISACPKPLAHDLRRVKPALFFCTGVHLDKANVGLYIGRAKGREEMFLNMAIAIVAFGMPVAALVADTLPFQFAGVPAYQKVPVHQRLRHR
jgi:hypothetical protein